MAARSKQFHKLAEVKATIHLRLPILCYRALTQGINSNLVNWKWGQLKIWIDRVEPGWNQAEYIQVNLGRVWNLLACQISVCTAYLRKHGFALSTNKTLAGWQSSYSNVENCSAFRLESCFSASYGRVNFQRAANKGAWQDQASNVPIHTRTFQKRTKCFH